MSDQPAMLRMSLLDMQVCVPEVWTDDQVVAWAEGCQPCGTTAGWAVRREGDPHLLGDPERVPCLTRTGFIHVILEA